MLFSPLFFVICRFLPFLTQTPGDVFSALQPDTVCRKRNRVYHATVALPTYASQLDVFNAVGVDALKTVWDGFNAASWSLVAR